ncbi:hypothetical protein AM500_18205 [Bacillus sp. FJAT-18017]|uniref:DUF4091 domain-containing protein n=1 Tax=Bacillus sp. FJAT-18017 TaxID=1705566 RepID=UPI0006B00A14|nr:DUF4091 domain-containing protein [Bacillus sp. FJAT-18017]ALC91502.1 hypothetical protein AM500_18205 [Bacillus sp. FJAT-18017]
MDSWVIETRCIHSLIKVFPDQDLTATPYKKGSALSNETFSFQVAYRAKGKMIKDIGIEIETQLLDSLEPRVVGLVPSELPCYEDPDEWILRSTPGLYPDPLLPITEEGVIAFPNQWRSIWITIHLEGKSVAGLHPITVRFVNQEGEVLGTEEFKLTIFPQLLPEQKLIHTEWFHTDCLALQYNVNVFSEEHWELIESYVETAGRHGINMILTPLFTPPLDTAVGSERPTVQLVDVRKEGENYSFSFEKVDRWVELCKRKGIKYFEFAHFFTQWGAKSAPKIIATENGEQKRIFGWETDAAGNEYKAFLAQFFPELNKYIKSRGLEECVYFHVSDEPSLEHLESYSKASQLINQYVNEYPVIDALSDFQFYEKGLVKNPIPSNDHIDPFIMNEVPNLWTYYCCLQTKDVSNRFFNFPSSRNRIIGFQLYKFGIAGFLHWGYNFWFTKLSKAKIDPFRNTDAGYSFPSGDAFLVYPGETGPIESVRMEVFYEALQDLRALQLLESVIGREEVIRFIEEGLEKPLTFSEFPRENDWILIKREELNRKIGVMFNNKIAAESQ